MPTEDCLASISIGDDNLIRFEVLQQGRGLGCHKNLSIAPIRTNEVGNDGDGVRMKPEFGLIEHQYVR